MVGLLSRVWFVSEIELIAHYITFVHLSFANKFKICFLQTGKGTRIRTRQYVRKDSIESCSIKLIQKQSCTGRPELCKQTTKGKKLQTKVTSCLHVKSLELTQQTCTIPLSLLLLPLTNSSKDANNTCTKPVDSGPCKANIERWHYDASKGMCVKFVYGGCLGNSNNFGCFQDCESNCLLILKNLSNNPLMGY